MASISSMGVGSGMDIQSLVQNLVAAERQPVDQRLARRETTLSVQLSALGTLKGAMGEFQSALSALKNIGNFNKRTATSGNNDFFTASASSSASAGSYEIEVRSTAQAHKIATPQGAFTAATDVVGTGTLTFQFGDPTKPAQTVTIDPTHSSLEGVRDAVNAANVGVRASIVTGDAGPQLVFASPNSGLDNALQVSVVDADGNNTDANGLSRLVSANMTEIAAAKDAEIYIDGIKVTSSSNTFTGAIEGVTLTVKKAEVGTKNSLTVGLDKSGTSTAVDNFIKAYNSLMSTINEVSGYNAETKQAGSLIGDASVRGITMQLRQVLSSVIEGGPFRSLADIGMKTGKDGTLTLDSAKLTAALASNYDEVGRLFAAAGKPSDSHVRFVSATSGTQPGDYDVAITQMATRGAYTGNAATSFVVGATNDTFAIKVDGVSSGTITLGQGTYTGTQLAAELQSRINGESTLKNASAAVTVEFNGSAFVLTSDRYGSASKVEIVSGDTTFAADFGLASGAGTTGMDVTGSIGGVTALGTGQTLTAPSGLKLEVTDGAAANSTVLFSRGIADRIDSLLTGLLDSKGPLASKTKSLNDRVADVTEQREEHERRMALVEQRYRAQFTAMDSLISKLNSTGSYLNQQLASIANLSGGGS